MRKLTQGDPGREFMAQQLLSSCGLNTCLPHGGCKELRDLLPCGDGDELPVEREQGRRHHSANPSAPGEALGSVVMQGARTGNYPEMSAARKCSTKSSAQSKFPLLLRPQEPGTEEVLRHSSRTELLMHLLRVRRGRIEKNA